MFTVSVNFNIRPGVLFSLKELSFFEYKTLCKSLFYEDNVQKISNTLEKLIDNTVIGDKPIDVVEKVLILLEIRSLTLGNDVRLKIGDKNITLEKSFLTDCLNKQHKKVEIALGDVEIDVTVPNNFIVGTNTSYIIRDCIDKIKIKDKSVRFADLNKEEQSLILNIIPGIPITDLIETIKQNLNHYSFNISKEYTVSPFNNSILYLLKAILIEPYQEVLDMEYNLRRGLNMTTYDMQNTPYPECKIMLAKLYKEGKEKDNSVQLGGPINNQ